MAHPAGSPGGGRGGKRPPPVFWDSPKARPRRCGTDARAFFRNAGGMVARGFPRKRRTLCPGAPFSSARGTGPRLKGVAEFCGEFFNVWVFGFPPNPHKKRKANPRKPRSTRRSRPGGEVVWHFFPLAPRVSAGGNELAPRRSTLGGFFWLTMNFPGQSARKKGT